MLILKKLFDWTPRDIAYWEKIQQAGLGNFVLRYGLAITGGLLFLVFGVLTLFGWLKQGAGQSISLERMIFLLEQLAFVAVVCLLAGVTNSLITWLVEQKLYHKYKALPKE